MAHYTIDHACGHKGAHQLTGKQSTRQWILGQRAQEPCPDCSRAAREEQLAIVKAQREQANQAAAESNQAAGLPALKGTPKQIAWAESIRRDQLARIERYELHHDHLKGATTAASKQVDASWWIDHRDKHDVPYLLEALGFRHPWRDLSEDEWHPYRMALVRAGKAATRAGTTDERSDTQLELWMTYVLRTTLVTG